MPGQRKRTLWKEDRPPKVPIVQRFMELDAAFQKEFSYVKRDSAVRVLKQSMKPRTRVRQQQVDDAISYLEGYLPAALELNEKKKQAIRKMQKAGYPVPRLRIEIAKRVGENLEGIRELVKQARAQRTDNASK
ncbi:MAG: hypothetical protein HY392_03325 [Candidatus Diapherotrites archaeon]|nr:hypothetical protein [Candidatus Diapherotrites archaeon]